jgi:hypothetical protein
MRTSLIQAVAVLLISVSLVGCGPRALSTDTTAHTLAIGGSDRRVTTMTDVDRIRDMAATEDTFYAATDRGLLMYPMSGEATPTRITRAEGLPSDDVTSVFVGSEGTVLVSTATGLAIVREGHANAVASAPPVGKIADVAITGSNTVWACGRGGLARLKAGQNGWVLFGESAQCTRLAVSSEGSLWVGTTTGMWLVENEEIVREHSQSRGIPEPYVADIAPLANGQVMALLRGPSSTLLGYWDGHHWYGYTLEGFTPKVLSLVAVGSRVMLITEGHAFVVASGHAEGVPLVALNASETFGVRSYRARITEAAAVVVPEGNGEPMRAPSIMSEVPTGQPTVDAPHLEASPSSITVPDGLYAMHAFGSAYFLADQNRGVVHLQADGTQRLLRTNDLVSAGNLQVATDNSQRTWLVTKHGDLVQLDDDGGLRRMSLPENVHAMAIANGDGGAHLLARVGDTGSVLRVYRADSGRWTQVVERTIRTATEFVGSPMIGVGAGSAVWAVVDVRRTDGEGTRTGGVVILDPAVETVTYLHRGATVAADGPGAMSIPDEISGIDFSENNVWLATLEGAVRIGNSQAVVFGEARGVRGEVVSDLAAAPGGRLWVAAAEGVGVYQNGSFDFSLPAVVQQARPTTLAVDTAGNLYCAGPRGAVYYDGTAWQTLTEQTGFPTNNLVDVRVDGRDRVWFLTDDRVLVFTR